MRASRWDFDAIARAIKSHQEHGSTTQLASDIANVLQQSNPRFDKVTFMDACGVDRSWRSFRDLFEERYGK